jgi:hypothetical protein
MFQITSLSDIAGQITAKSENADQATAASVYLPSGALKYIRRRVPKALPKWRDATDAAVECVVDLIARESLAALVKYASPFALFYFPKLRPGADYLAAGGDAAVEAIVEAELARPGLHRDIAESGRAFYRRFLRRDPLLAYTAQLLRAYAGVIGTPISPRTAPP